MTGTEIIPYDPGFKDEVANLLTLLVSRDPAQARRYFEWQYEENPYFRDPILYLARSDGRIVGMRGLLGASWQAGPNPGPVVMPYPDDHIVVEDKRGSGIVTLIMRAMLADAQARGYDFLCNVSAGLVTTLASLAAGWKRVGPMEPVARSHQPGRLARWSRLAVKQSEQLKRLSRRRGGGPDSADAFRRLDRAGKGPGAERGTEITVAESPRVEAMAALVERMGHDGRMRHVRDVAYLTWRYRHPLRDYRFLWHETAGLLDGYLVVRRYRDPQAPPLRADIVDWEATEDPIASVLLDRVTEWGQFSQLGSWTVTLPETRLRMLAAAGFEPTDLDRRARGLPGVLVIAVGRRDPEAEWVLNGRRLLDLAQWDLRQIYSMHG